MDKQIKFNDIYSWIKGNKTILVIEDVQKSDALCIFIENESDLVHTKDYLVSGIEAHRESDITVTVYKAE